MSAEDDEWLLPSLGSLDVVKLAIAGVRRAMGYIGARPAPPPRTAAPTPPTEMERGLWDLVTAQAKLSAVLLQMLEHATRAGDAPLAGEAVLDVIRTQQQARADLDTLDDGAPFDV